MRQIFTLLAVSIFFARLAGAQVLMSGGTYSQNFDSLASSGTANTWTDNSTLPGWYASKTNGGTVILTYRADPGTNNTGAIYSFGTNDANGITDRALGSVASGTPGNFAYGVRFTNDTGLAQSNITVSYTGEQWRNGGNASAQKLAFSYLVSSAPILNSDAVGASNWTAFTALDFTTPTVGATATVLDGNLPANEQVLTNVVLAGVVVQAGQEIFLRWFDLNDTGNDHGIALDNLTVSFSSTSSAPGNTPPFFTTQPQNQTISTGSNVMFTVVAGGTAPLSYQWQSNSVAVPGATNSSFTLIGITTNLNGSTYFVTVTNIAGSSNSQTATLTVNPPAAPTPPFFTAQPQSQTNNVGSNVTFSIVAGGTVPLSYQWQSNSVAVPGATNSSFTLTSVATNLTGSSYFVTVTNIAGSTNSQTATLTVNPPPSTPPFFTTQPQGQTNNVGSNVTFTVVAGGTVPLSYQWQSNSVAVPGATNSSFTLIGITTNLNGSTFFVTVTNIAGSTNSQIATLTVNPPAATNSSSATTSKTLRIVSYNIDCEDRSSDGNITNSFHSLPTVVQGIGLHHLGTNAQPMDLMSCEELNSTTLANFVTQLNLIYGAGTYTYDTTTDPNSGGGPDGIIYRTNSVQVISARALPYGQTVLLQSNGTYISAHSPGGGVNGVARAPMVYQIRPVGSGTNNDFYFYVSHARSTSDDTQGDARYAEAQEVRSDAKYNLPAGSHILYGGDWNLFNGSGENAYKCLTGQITSDGIDWSDNSAIWGNTNQTQGFDPMSKTVPPTTVSWANVSGDNANYLYADSTASLTSRIDIQLPNALMFAAYNKQGGIQLAPDTSDPYDTSNFPSAQYPYAFESFGNNGSTPLSSSSTSSGNHSLDDLAGTVPNAATVYSDLLETGTGSGSTFIGSDHYPIFGDYNVVTLVATPVLGSLAIITNGQIQFTITGAAGGKYAIDATTNLSPANWIPVLTNQSPFIFSDTNVMSQRFYRARFVQ
jgi:hypothetical protein